MKIKTAMIAPEMLNAFASALSKAVPGITGTMLLKAIEDFVPEEDGEMKRRPPGEELMKPMTIKEVGQFLGMSRSTIHRLMRRGQLRRIRVSSKLVRVDGKSVRQLLEAKEADSDGKSSRHECSNLDLAR